MASATKTFWTSFFDGLTGEGIFGDLQIPGAPTKLFKEEPSGQAAYSVAQSQVESYSQSYSEMERQRAARDVAVVGAAESEVRPSEIHFEAITADGLHPGVVRLVRTDGKPFRFYGGGPLPEGIIPLTGIQIIDDSVRHGGDLPLIKSGITPGFVKAAGAKVEGVKVDVDGEKINIARDREGGWIIVDAPATEKRVAR